MTMQCHFMPSEGTRGSSELQWVTLAQGLLQLRLGQPEARSLLVRGLSRLTMRQELGQERNYERYV